MDSLTPNWITEGYIDFEYKKYILLAYLQQVSHEFDEKKLYPVLNELIAHYNNLLTIKKNKEFVANQFPKQISRVDLENFKVEFERMIVDEKYLAELEQIIDFAIPRLNKSLVNGKEIYQEVEDSLKIFPVGIISINAEEGYMMLTRSSSKQTSVYSYAITIFENVDEKFRGIKTSFIGEYQRSITNTFEEIKLQLVHDFHHANNPATYVIESEKTYPLHETFLPIAKRSLVRYLFKPAA